MIWALLLILFVPSFADAATYYADPAGGGAASCVDTGANVCTLARAEAVATHGDTVQAACGTYDMGATSLTVNVNIAIAPVTAGCGIITGTNASAIVILTVANNANVLTFGAFDVRNTGGGTSSTLLVSNAAYDQTVVLSGTRITVGGTNRFIADQYTRGTLKLEGITVSGTVGAQAGFYSVVTPSAAKKLSITDSTFDVAVSASTTPVILVERAAASSTSEWVYIEGNTITAIAPTGLGNNIQVIPIRLNRITYGDNLSSVSTPPIIENNTITLTALAVTATDSMGIVVSSTDATAVAHGAQILNNTVTCNTPAARCISVGTDPITLFYANDVLIAGNTVTSSFYNGVATTHGVHCGRVTNCTIRQNRVNGFAAAILSSMSTTSYIYGNLVVGSYYAPLFAKGNTSAFFSHNTVIMNDALYGAKFGNYGCLGAAAQGATNNAATTFQNNLCYVASGTGWKHVVVDASQVATFDANDYYSVPTLTTPWRYQGSATAAIATWNANATVGTDLTVDPLFVGATDYRLRASSSLIYAGANGLPCLDHRGRACYLLNPNIGAYQSSSGDPAATRAVRN